MNFYRFDAWILLATRQYFVVMYTSPAFNQPEAFKAYLNVQYG